MKYTFKNILFLLCIGSFFLGKAQHIKKCSDDGSGWRLKNVQIKWQNDSVWTDFSDLKNFLLGKNHEAKEKGLQNEFFYGYETDSLQKFEGNLNGNTNTNASEDAMLKQPENGIEIRYAYQAKPFKNPHNHYRLFIPELDPLAKIYVNNVQLFTNKNYFIPVNIGLPDELNTKDSFELRLLFPFLPEAGKDGQTYPTYDYPTDNDPTRVAQFFRKPAHHFGWDVCPRFLAGNVFTQPEIITWSGLYLHSVFVKQDSLSEKKAVYSLQLEIICDKATESGLKIKLNNQIIADKILRLQPGTLMITEKIYIRNPKRWWPNGIFQQKGEQAPALYHVELELNNTGLSKPSACYQYQKDIGIRTIQLEQKKDAFGESFLFRVNGEAVFAKGSNYASSLFPDTEGENEKNTNLFASLRHAGFNMIRIWGGGKYPSENFLEHCDKNGILLWQDFMFAGTMYPGDSLFLNNVKQEAEFEVKRISQHPCLALWCGNNEIDVARKNWGWAETYKQTASVLEYLNGAYDSIFTSILPRTIKSYDPEASYIHTSPLSNWGKKEDFYAGDNHYWGVWHGELAFESYLDHIPRFMSEYGFPSFPSMRIIRKYFALQRDTISDPAFRFRMRSYKGNKLIEKYLKDNFGEAKNLESFVLLSQLQQAYAGKMAIEAHRRAKPYCMGTLYWQLNDVWPGISWSSIDYDQNKKAVWFTTRDAYANVILSASTTRDYTEVYAISDLIQDTSSKIQLTLMDFYGKKIFDSTFNYSIKANSSSIIFSKKTSSLLMGKNQNEVVLVMRLLSKKNEYRNLFYYVRPKELNLPKAELNTKVKNNSLILTSNVLVKDLYIESGDTADIKFFDLLPGEKKILLPGRKGISSFRIYPYKQLVK